MNLIPTYRPHTVGVLTLAVCTVSLTIPTAIVYGKTADGVLSWHNYDVSWPAAHAIAWYDDYAAARDRAVSEGRMLFIYFRDAERNAAQEAFESITLSNPKVCEALQRFVAVRLSVDTRIAVDGQQIRLIEHGAFGEMCGRQGVAVVDYEEAGSEHYGQVVSAFPFDEGRYYRPQAVNVILDLPKGTLTQRTMVFAVRMHPDRPASTQGEFNPVLADEAESHSDFQARNRVQGHQRWNTRFHRISNRLRGALSREVVAQSWGGESLVEACHECVRSWRQSTGHWGEVRTRHSMFAFDIKRGSNGVWYATGLFADGG